MSPGSDCSPAAAVGQPDQLLHKEIARICRMARPYINTHGALYELFAAARDQVCFFLFVCFRLRTPDQNCRMTGRRTWIRSFSTKKRRTRIRRRVRSVLGNSRPAPLPRGNPNRCLSARLASLFPPPYNNFDEWRVYEQNRVSAQLELDDALYLPDFYVTEADVNG